MSNDDIFSATPPTKPGWYWIRLQHIVTGEPAQPSIVEVFLDPVGSLAVLDVGCEYILPSDVNGQWDPTPILGPGELQKMREALALALSELELYRHAQFCQGDDVGCTDAALSAVRSALSVQAPEPQSTVTASTEER